VSLNRVFPCQSCIRRGCAHLCPNGTLASTKGNKVLMAHVNRLTEQVKILTKRVHELESSLASRGQYRPENHSGVDNVSAEHWTQEIQGVSDTIGTLSIGVNGQIKYHGGSAGSKVSHARCAPADEDWHRAPMQSSLPVEILELVNSFLFGMQDCPYDKYTHLPHLPSRDRALELSELYYKHHLWALKYDPVINAEFMARVIEPMYGSTEDICLDSIHSHTLSVLFVILASGVLHDPHPDKQRLSDQYLAISRGALALDPIFHEATCATVQALFMILRYNHTFDRSGTEERWLLDEVQQRRRIFWEIYMYYAWTSIVNGRPPAYTPPPKARFSPFLLLDLLHMHRSYFAQAIRQDSNDPVKQQFAQSALATYRSACRIISSLRGLYEVHKGDATDCRFLV
ncbi:hypothetical protein BDN71DRAFT_1384144, partial [Pleurotus eryngii]